MPIILFLAGPSGAGKSTFSSAYLRGKGWRHLEIDRYPEGDGIDLENLRSEWNDFLERGNPGPLNSELRRRMGSTKKMVISLPSNLVFGLHHHQISRGLFHIAYLFGHPALCLRDFLIREKSLKRGLDADHWNKFAPAAFGGLSLSVNHTFLVEVFTSLGKRRADDDIYRDLLRIIERS